MYDLTPQVVLSIRNSLKCNKGLKKVKLGCNSIFDEDFSSEINFKLTEFDAFALRLDRPDLVQNFEKFLATQKDSLEILTIKGRKAIAVAMKTILSMPRLKKLCLKKKFCGRDNIQLEAGIYQQNFSVATLDLEFIQIENIDFHEIILSAFPRVETLRIWLFSDEIANLISEKCKSLKKLHVLYFRARNIDNMKFYRNLENFTHSCSVYKSSQRLFNELGVEPTLNRYEKMPANLTQEITSSTVCCVL